jgi:predicted kinase
MKPDAYLANFRRPLIRSATPVLVVVGGLPASGKSHFARALAARTGAAHVTSDGVRLALADGKPNYSSAESVLTHGTVRELTTRLIAAGCHVISDATNMTRRNRAAALSVPGAARRILVWCEADEATALSRFALRAAKHDAHDASEATAEIRFRMAANAEPPTTALMEADGLFLVTPATYAAVLDAVVSAMDVH